MGLKLLQGRGGPWILLAGSQDLEDGSARDDGATHCATTATKYSYPCARNALEIGRVANDGYAEDDGALHYGQLVRPAPYPMHRLLCIGRIVVLATGGARASYWVNRPPPRALQS